MVAAEGFEPPKGSRPAGLQPAPLNRASVRCQRMQTSITLASITLASTSTPTNIPPSMEKIELIVFSFIPITCSALWKKRDLSLGGSKFFFSKRQTEVYSEEKVESSLKDIFHPRNVAKWRASINPETTSWINGHHPNPTLQPQNPSLITNCHPRFPKRHGVARRSEPLQGRLIHPRHRHEAPRGFHTRQNLPSWSQEKVKFLEGVYRERRGG